MPLRLWTILALLGYMLTAALSWRCETVLFPPADGTRSQEVGEVDPASPAYATQRISQGRDFYAAEYSFEAFARERLQVSYQVPRKAYDSYCAGFWYSRGELDAIAAATTGRPAERDRRIRAYLSSRGFKLLAEDVIAADIPLMTRRSVLPLRPVAQALDRLSREKNYDSESLIGVATAMVQTALRYQIPPLLEGGRHTGGALPPAMAMIRGWGDCDTKSGVLASIMSNWDQIRMVGIATPDHYLLGLLRIPGRGDAFVEYQGLQYVLIEPSGPAWLAPGSVGVDTMPKLQSAEGFRIEPFFDSPG